MHDEAAETERRCTEIADGLDGKKTAILEEARATKSKGAEMMSTYLDDDADALDGFEFLTMAEAGEVGHWSVLKKLNEKKGSQEIDELVDVGAAHPGAPPEARHGDIARAGIRRGSGRRGVSAARARP